MKGFTAWLKDKAKDLFADLKKAWKSWYVWFNGAVMPTLVVYWPQIWEELPQLYGSIPDSKYQTLIVFGSVVNILLRFKTTKALRNK